MQRRRILVRRIAALYTVVSILCLGAGTSYGQETSPELAEAILGFAEFLADGGDFLRAAHEYERYRYLRDVDTAPHHDAAVFPSDDYVLGRIGDCYQCAGLPGEALHYFDGIARSGGSEDARSLARIEIAYCRVMLGEYAVAAGILAGEQRSDEYRATRLLALTEIYSGNWAGAVTLLEPRGAAVDRELYNLAVRGAQMERRSPVTAALLSVVMPGAGKVYAGEGRDGLFSMVSIGLLGVLSYVGFRDDGVTSIRGWSYASLGALFYCGNVYGSAAAARRTNRRREEALLADAERFMPPCWE